MTTVPRTAEPGGPFTIAAAIVLLQGSPPANHSATIRVSPRLETAPAPSAEDAADDLAIWHHPTRPDLGMLIGTDKQTGLLVYDLDGKQRQYLADGRLNNVDIRYRFPLGGKEVALVTSGERGQNVLAAYAVDEESRTLKNVGAGVGLGFDAGGSCMYRSRKTGDTYFFCTSKDGVVKQWRLYDDGQGRVGGAPVRTFDAGGECEGCVADDENGWLFVSEEDVGIWRYGAEPDDGDARVKVDGVGTEGHLDDDVEGLTIYYAWGGDGYLLASSQGSDDFVVYERRAPHKYRCRFEIGASAERDIDEVTDTDGIDVTNLGFGELFPVGLFAAQDGSNPRGNQNYKVVDWRDIARAADPPLVIDPDYDAHGARRSRP